MGIRVFIVFLRQELVLGKQFSFVEYNNDSYLDLGAEGWCVCVWVVRGPSFTTQRREFRERNCADLHSKLCNKLNQSIKDHNIVCSEAEKSWCETVF